MKRGMLVSAPVGWPARLGPEAFHGPCGDLLRRIEPLTEADVAGKWLHMIGALGSGMGPGPRIVSDGSAIHANVSGALVGATATGRKGTADNVTRPFAAAINGFDWRPPASGGSSGEGYIELLTDKDAEEGAPNGRTQLVVETELSTQIRRSRSETNSQTGVLRDLLDRGRAQVIRRKDPVSVDGAHFSLIGHITPEELVELTQEVDLANGYYNRLLWFVVRRSRNLPMGERIDVAGEEFREPVERLRRAVSFARYAGEASLSKDAFRIYECAYDKLLGDAVGGSVGKVMARSATHPLRIGLVFAALDLERSLEPITIRVPHLLAGLEATRFAGDSAAHIFGAASEFPDADVILTELRATAEGLSKSDVSRLFNRHRSAAELDAAIGYLMSKKLIISRRADSSGGRPADLFCSNPDAPDAEVPRARPWGAAMDAARALAAEIGRDTSAAMHECPPLAATADRFDSGFGGR